MFQTASPAPPCHVPTRGTVFSRREYLIRIAPPSIEIEITSKGRRLVDADGVAHQAAPGATISMSVDEFAEAVSDALLYGAARVSSEGSELLLKQGGVDPELLMRIVVDDGGAASVVAHLDTLDAVVCAARAHPAND